MAELISIDDAKARLRIDGDDDDAVVQDILAEATAIVVKHIKKPDHGWTAATVPDDIKSAILLVAARICADREGNEDWLNEGARRILNGHRDPSLA